MQGLAVERHLDAQPCFAADPAGGLFPPRDDDRGDFAAIVENALQLALEIGEHRVAARQHVIAVHIEDDVVGRQGLHGRRGSANRDNTGCPSGALESVPKHYVCPLACRRRGRTIANPWPDRRWPDRRAFVKLDLSGTLDHPAVRLAP